MEICINYQVNLSWKIDMVIQLFPLMHRRIIDAMRLDLTPSSITGSLSIVVEEKSRPKTNPDDLRKVVAPIPGKITQVTITVGHRVNKGDPLFTLEAMKMYTSVTAPLAGVVHRIEVAEGDVVEVKDLLVSLR